MTRERPSLFQPDMVRALRRTVSPKRQTRRLHRLGDVGDVLWAREAWRTDAVYDKLPPREVPFGAPIVYEADGTMQQPPIVEPWPVGKLRPSMFMCRWICRMKFLIVDVREERLGDISEADAMAEGVDMDAMIEMPLNMAMPWCVVTAKPRDARQAFFHLWVRINGMQSLVDNPTVFAHTLERIE